MGERSYFEVLGVSRAFHLDGGELERRYLALSKQYHPDRFAKALPGERLLAVRHTTELNDAYRVLKSETKRAEYLLKLEGIDIGEERAGVKVEPSLLMEVMERNEALAEARMEGDAGRVRSIADEVRREQAVAWERVKAGFRQYEAGDRGVLAGIAQALILLRYHARLFEQVEAFEEREVS